MFNFVNLFTYTRKIRETNLFFVAPNEKNITVVTLSDSVLTQYESLFPTYFHLLNTNPLPKYIYHNTISRKVQ